ncbi:MAG TPA: PPOX class F420-dependent oxidoreductase [Candidatus Dormibacteraeota bacterium]|nr:PPOX class F420-dependent oxidoreductase [Candidatus Dormibacteraeota bacterium]
MTIPEALDFIRDHPRAVLATTRRDGQPQLSPVLAAVDHDGAVLISTREPAAKTRNLRRSARATLLALSEQFFGSWVTVGGAVTIETLPEALPALEHYYRLVSGEHPNWDDYRAAMAQERRVILRLRVDAAGPGWMG